MRERIIAVPFVAAVFFAGLFAQSTLSATQPLEFEVASVKPHLQPEIRGVFRNRPRQFTSHGTYFTAHGFTIQEIIMQAFVLEDYQVSGLPDWAKLKWGTPDLEYYDVDARTPHDDPTNGEIRGMLQSLLMERCRLKFHWEERELQVHALVVAKGGLRAKEMPSGSGYLTVYGLIQLLSRSVDRPIVDHTGLEGEYAFELTAGLNAARGDVSEISAILGDRLGLKLERGKEATKVLVVDHVERPTPN